MDAEFLFRLHGLNSLKWESVYLKDLLLVLIVRLQWEWEDLNELFEEDFVEWVLNGVDLF